jgi:hypothetical protein
MASRPSAPRRFLATSPFNRQEVVPPTTSGFHTGDLVTLDSCGMGKVLSVTTECVTVDFGASGIRQILAGTRGFSLL